MKIGRVFPDLLPPLDASVSLEARLAQVLRRLVVLTGAAAGGLVFRPPAETPIIVTGGRRGLSPELEGWIRRALEAPGRGRRLARVTPPPTGRPAMLLRVPLGAPRARVGRLLFLGRGRTVGRRTLPAGFPREFGVAIEQVWRRHRRTLRMAVLNDLTNLLVSGEPLDAVFRGFGQGLARLVPSDAMAVALVDRERGDAEVVDVLARSVAGGPCADGRMPIAGTLLATVVDTGHPVRVDDLATSGVTCPLFAAHGHRAALLVPLLSGGGAVGAVMLAAGRSRAFDDEDREVVAELARPLASAIEQRRLLDETRRRAEELRALYATSQHITARLDVAAVLDGISRSVTALIGSTGCGIGLLDEAGTMIHHAAAHGFLTEEWRALAIPVAQGLIGCSAATGEAIRVDDIHADPRSARRDIDVREGIRAMLCVPLRAEGRILGVISAFSTRPAVFTAHHQRVLEAFAEQAGIAITNARLYEQSERRARETHALLEAGRAVTASLDVAQTMSVIMAQAKSVLGVTSCGIMTLEAGTGDLVSVASLDLPTELAQRIRVREGEGITGMAVREGRPVQSPDILVDERVRYRDVQAQAGLRSMLAVPLRLGSRAIGALIVFRHDAHRFSPAEEDLLIALADQAAIALEHARLYQRLEARVAERTRELDAQKRAIELVLQCMPLGVFVLDGHLDVVLVNREGERVLPTGARAGSPFTEFLSDATGDIAAWLVAVRDGGHVERMEREMPLAGETRVVRLTAVPLEVEAGRDLVVLVEDMTPAKRLEQQLLLTERLTTAGKLAAGVAHELNNPLATIAGCAESLLARLREPGLPAGADLADFIHYLSLIEEEAYRCKEITGSLLQFVREPGSRRVSTDLNTLAQKVVELLSHQSRFTRSHFELVLDPALPEVTVNEGQLRQVMLGIAANGLEAMAGDGTLVIRTRAGRDEVEVEFEDEGPGIPDEVLPRIFDPFFTTRPSGQGTGLGLAIAQGIVADHQGRIEITSRPGKGSVFRVVLPR